MCLLSLAVLSFMACDDDEKRSASPAFNAESMQVYFSKDNQNVFELLPTEKKIELTVCRDVFTEAATVKIGLKAGDNFSVSDVKFDAGDADTTMVVSFDNLEPFEVNYLELSIENKYCNPYVANANGTSVFSCSVTVTDWADYAYGTYTSGILDNSSWNLVMQYSNILQCYKLVDVYSEGCNLLFDFDAETGEITPKGYSKDADDYYIVQIGDAFGGGAVETMSIDASLQYTGFNKESKMFKFNGLFSYGGSPYDWFSDTFVIDSYATDEE